MDDEIAEIKQRKREREEVCGSVLIECERKKNEKIYVLSEEGRKKMK